jgi:hypothetical protein
MSTSPSASASSTPPTLPPEAEGTSPEAAKAFVRYWVDAMNYAAATGGTAPARSVSSSACGSCHEMLDKIASVYEAGGVFRGEGWQILQMRYQPFQRKTHPIVSVGIRVARQVMIPSASSDPEIFKGGRNQLNLHLIYQRQQWRIRDLERLS